MTRRWSGRDSSWRILIFTSWNKPTRILRSFSSSAIRATHPFAGRLCCCVRGFSERRGLLERKPRHFPFQFEDASHETDVYEFELPKEYSVEDVPEPVDVDMGFAAYHSKIEIAGNKLRYSREFIRREVLVQPDRVEQLRKMQGIIGADENTAVLLKRNS